MAEGELTLVDEMIASKAYAAPQRITLRLLANRLPRWEPLKEKAAPGQWGYFERVAHTGKP